MDPKVHVLRGTGIVPKSNHGGATRTGLVNGNLGFERMVNPAFTLHYHRKAIC
jgi:hypothetical protein